MNYTTHKKIQKPISIEKYNVGVFNTNADIIDSELNKHDIKNNALEKSINDETTRAKKAESDETIRATNAEKVLTDNLSSEINRAKKAESDNSKALNDEITRASDAESNLDSKKANINSPNLIGVPKSPTASVGTNTTQIATTAFTQTAVLNHNTSNTAHIDIRNLITGLTNRLNALADSDDVTLDQLSEIVSYIKSNRTLIENITTNKVNVSDIIDNLISTSTNKPLSANQGRLLKELIDNLNSALNTHIENSDVHITSAERTNWNTVTKKVDKVSGKGLSTHDLTSVLKSNYDTAYTHSQSSHAPSNAQANIIESISVNGIKLTINSKSVDVVIPTKLSDLANDVGFITESDVGGGTSGDLETITDLEIDELFNDIHTS